MKAPFSEKLFIWVMFVVGSYGTLYLAWRGFSQVIDWGSAIWNVL